MIVSCYGKQSALYGKKYIVEKMILKESSHKGPVWYHTAGIQALGRLKQETLKFRPAWTTQQALDRPEPHRTGLQ